MPQDRTSAGDPARTLALLWGRTEVPRRGPGRGLQVTGVIVAATRVADAEGLAALSMRRLAAELEVSAMTLYTYVPGRAELLDLVLDAAYRELPLADTTGRPWRERITAVADENRGLYLAHPWAAALSTLRPPLGPGLMAKYEHELAAFDGLGLDDLERDDALSFLLGFVQSTARAATDARAAATASAMSDDQWWAAHAPLLAEVLDERVYPLASRVGSAVGQARGTASDPEQAYRFGLQRVLAGLAGLVGGG